jgi:uncharacterized protein
MRINMRYRWSHLAIIAVAVALAAEQVADAASPTDRLFEGPHTNRPPAGSSQSNDFDASWSLTQSPSPVRDATDSSPISTPSLRASRAPSIVPTTAPDLTPEPTIAIDVIVELPPLYRPGNLIHYKEGLLLSEGLDCRIIARTNQTVPYQVLFRDDSGLVDYHDTDDSVPHSTLPFHQRPDMGATYWDKDDETNPGGWVYVSNSEMKDGQGGVGRLKFDRYGNVLDYTMLLSGTSMNCGGGRTPWDTWVSCEEVIDVGQLYQVDPSGLRPPELMSMASEGGIWESFAYDDRDKETPRFFVTEDHHKGCLRRYTPEVTNWTDPWQMLHNPGKTEYLVLYPNATNDGGTFEWIDDFHTARENAFVLAQHPEGIDVYDGQLYFVCKKIKMLFSLDLDKFTYYNHTTVHGLFDGSPDQMQRILGDSRDMLYFTEEIHLGAGVHARDHLGRFYTVFESPDYVGNEAETTGLAFSPDGRFLYTAYQDAGILYAVWRIDGMPFQARQLDVRYHARS